MQKGTESLGGELPSSNIERSTIQKVIQLLNVTDTHLIIITIILLYKTKENISTKKTNTRYKEASGDDNI